MRNRILRAQRTYREKLFLQGTVQRYFCIGSFSNRHRRGRRHRAYIFENFEYLLRGRKRGPIVTRAETTGLRASHA